MGAAPRFDQQALAAARLWATHRFPYLASALFACRLVAVPGLRAIAVDRWWRIHADPAVVDSLPVEELGALLVHHVGHLLRDPAERAEAVGVVAALDGDDRLLRKWVLAADIEINDDLDLADLPAVDRQGILPGDVGCEPGRLAEEYFHQLPDGERCCRDCGSGAHGRPRPWETDDRTPRIAPAAGHLLRCQVAAEVLRCHRDGIGTVPLGLERWARGVLEPRVDWRRVLAAELRRGIGSVVGAVDYTYSRPSRRARAVPRVVLPALHRPVPEVAVVCDTSRSMGDELLGEVLAEVEGILRGVGVRHAPVLACDVEVHTTRRVASARQVRLARGGGTDMGAGIAAAVRLRPRPDIVVVLTDGLTPWPVEAPRNGRVVVGLVGGHPEAAAPEWARVVRVDDEP